MMLEPLNIPVNANQPTQLWTGTGNAPSLLIYNPDPVNTVYVGKRTNTSANGLNVIPVGPLQSFVVDGQDNWFGISSANGGKNLVIIPGGTNFFQPSTRITAGQFVAVGSGSGVFVYIGTPALGNPPVITLSESTTDPYGNVIRPGIEIIDTNPLRTDYIQLLPGSPPTINIGTGDVAEATPGQVISGIAGSGPTRTLGTEILAPRVTGEATGAIAELVLLSESADLTTFPPSAQLAAGDGTNSVNVTLIPTMIEANGPMTVTKAVTATGGTITSPSQVTTDTYAGTGITLGGGLTAVEALEIARSPDNTVTFSGRITVPATPGNPQTYATVGAGYIPGRTETFYAVENPGTPFNAIAHYAEVVTGTGIVRVYGTQTAGNTMSFQGHYHL